MLFGPQEEEFGFNKHTWRTFFGDEIKSFLVMSLIMNALMFCPMVFLIEWAGPNAWYGALNYRTAARTLFLRPYLAHFGSFLRHLFAVFSALTPGIRRVAQKTGGRLRNGPKRPGKEWSPPTYS